MPVLSLMFPRRWAALAFSLLLAACGGDDDSRATHAAPDTRIHLLAAEQGRLTPSSTGDGSWQLTLTQVSPQALWYTDRPAREAGTTAVTRYVALDWPRVYGEQPPNATLQFHPESSPALLSTYVALSRPTFDAAGQTLTFHIEPLDDTLQALPQRAFALGQPTLNILNNAHDDEAVASYIQYAESASLQPGATPGRYTLTLQQLAPDVFAIDNAPGRYTRTQNAPAFVEQWPFRFNDVPPNAALFGTAADGTLQLHAVTLTEPVYDATRQQMRYTATLLSPRDTPSGPLQQAVLSIDSGSFSRLPQPGKGAAYAAFGPGYNPSTANDTALFFGSDIARKQFGSLWGTSSHLAQSCSTHCRNDLQTLQSMGVNLIRLYDWDPRNDHSQFLDHAQSLGIQVLVPISNWLPGQPESTWTAQLPAYFKHGNFGNAAGNDWHPAIAGVLISNELDQISDAAYQRAIGLTAQFLAAADAKGFSKDLRVGLPVTFAIQQGAAQPSWHQFDLLVNDSRLASYQHRLMLTPNTYNLSDYLFGSSPGWVALTYAKFKLPILITEIGISRAQTGLYSVTNVEQQLSGGLAYQQQHPEQLLGVVHFQFSDKIWKQHDPTDTEGAFGSFHHGATIATLQPVASDFGPNEAGGPPGTLNIDKLETTTTHTAVTRAYGSP